MMIKKVTASVKKTEELNVGKNMMAIKARSRNSEFINPGLFNDSLINVRYQ